MSGITDVLSGGFTPKGTLSSGVGNFLQGTVTENNNKDFPAMVKVEFTGWEDGKNICSWIQLMRPYGGKDYGSYIVPEIGETVLVGFIGNGMKSPFVLGSLHTVSSDMVSQCFDDKNLTKRFKTKGGIDITIHDEDKKQKITLLTPKELTVVIDDENESISVANKGAKTTIQLDCKNGKIAVTGEKEILLKSGKSEVKLDGNKGEIAIKCDSFSIDATQKVEIKTNASAVLQGGTLSVEGKQTATLKGGTMTEITGGIVKVG